MYTVIAKFDCLWHEGIHKSKRSKVIYGLLQSLRKNLKCSVECVDNCDNFSGEEFSIGMSFVLPERIMDVETQFSNTAAELIEKKGEVEVHDYICTVVDSDDLLNQEDLVTLH